MKKQKKKIQALADIRTSIAAAKHTIQTLKERAEKREALRKELKESKAAIRNFEDSWKVGLLKVPGGNSAYHALKSGIYEKERKLGELHRENIEAKIRRLEHRVAELEAKQAQLTRRLRKQSPTERQPPKKKRTTITISVDPNPRTATAPRLSPQEVARQRPVEGLTNASFLASWSDVEFADGEIYIRHKGRVCRMPIQESRAYLNDIKAYYTFKNVPQLQVVVTDGKVEVKNTHSLFYHIKFLTLAGTEFGSIRYQKHNVRGWSQYKKEYYNRHLSFLFNKDTLRKLCAVCDANWPIIPVAELVVNSNGKKTIHNSLSISDSR